jgi:hypothetical protein
MSPFCDVTEPDPLVVLVPHVSVVPGSKPGVLPTVSSAIKPTRLPALGLQTPSVPVTRKLLTAFDSLAATASVIVTTALSIVWAAMGAEQNRRIQESWVTTVARVVSVADVWLDPGAPSIERFVLAPVTVCVGDTVLIVEAPGSVPVSAVVASWK